jgi:hypothetical protein
MALLPGHLRDLSAWQDLAEQIVVVDSFSTDGTWEYLNQHLRHPNVSFFQQPPGLYQSWNYGIGRIETEYAYIATVGDTISREGMIHLRQHAGALDAGVLVSKPVFMATETEPAAEIFWPVDDLISHLGVTAPRALSGVEVLLFTAVHLDGTLLGSSASNLYRTEVLRQFPFPTDCGKAGDAVWGLQHFADVKWAVTPEEFSTFLRHPDTTALRDRQNWKNSARLDLVLRRAVAEALAKGTISQSVVEEYGIPGLIEAAGAWLQGKEAFDDFRARGWPWYLNPAAWVARSLRGRQRVRLMEARDAVLSRLKKESSAGS